jgi:hypothetical protein
VYVHINGARYEGDVIFIILSVLSGKMINKMGMGKKFGLTMRIMMVFIRMGGNTEKGCLDLRMDRVTKVNSVTMTSRVTVLIIGQINEST